MRGRIIELEVTDKRGKAAKTIPLYQYDYGQKLLIKGVELPEYYEVHFSNQQYGDAITVLGDSTGVLIPDSLVATGETIYVWLFLHDTSYDGETEYMGAIPVIKRAQPTDVTPTPEEQSIITEVIAALNNMEDDMSEQVQAAEAAKEAAQTAQTAAEGAATTASGYVDTVTAAQTAAEAAQAAAETAATSATASATSATSSANSANNALAEATNAKIAAVDAASAASTSATTATTASGNASNYATSAESAKVDAVAAQTAAEAAQTAAETAQGKAEDAQGAAETAQTAAEAAQTAAETAQGKAEDAQTAAESAQESAEDSAEDSEAYAVGTRNGVDVDSDDPAYENNAKYYAEEAATVLEDKLDAPATAGTAGQVLTSDGEGGQAWADPSGAIDDTAGEGDTDVTWSADKLAETTGQLLTAIHGKPELKETDAENVDLDITDSDGDVLVRFKDGHIQTKEFNSKKIIAVKPTDAVGSDMDVADENGNVLLRMKDGEIITKNFNSGTDCKRVINPYKEVIFGSDEEVSITTHDHAKDQTAVDNLMSKNLDAIAISNYYPSQPYYPLSEYNLTVPAGTIEIPNAEHHGFTDVSVAMHLNAVGSTFASGSPSGQTPLGVADTWKHGIIKMKRGLLFADGGGITINHPTSTGLTTGIIKELLDFDEVVIGIEIYNQDCPDGKRWAIDIWDEILKTGRRCWGFAVPDHKAEGSGSTNWEGKIVLLVPDATQENCLKAIRNGEFYIKIKHTSLALTDLEVEGNSVTIEVSESATIKTIIDGVVVDSSVGTTKNVTIPSKAVYVRFEAETTNDKLFTNPIIFKGRK